MAQVFLSYARDDVGRAKAIAATIERAGFSVWWDRELVGGAEYSREIDDSLKAADAVVVLWSRSSVGSAWVRDEAAAGRDTGRLVPVRLDDAEVPLGFRQYQIIDLSRWNGRSNSTGLKTLEAAIAAKTGRSVSDAPSAHHASAKAARRSLRPLGIAIPLIVLAAIAAVAAYSLIGANRQRDLPAVAIIAADRGGQALARELAVDIGGLKASVADSFELIDAGAGAGDVDYVVRVASTRQGQAAVADLTLSSSNDPQILWSARYRRDDGDQLALQHQAASRLATLLKCLGEGRPPTGVRLDDATLKLYLRGCTQLDDIILTSVESDLVSTFRQVTERAPDFALAWVSRAYLEANSTTIGQSAANPEHINLARRYLERARGLNPRLGMTYLIEGELFPNNQWEQRMAVFQRGLAKDPDNAELHAAMSIELRQTGRINDSVESALKAAELNPLSPRIQSATVPILSAAGRFAEARQRLDIMERQWPDAPAVQDARYAFEMRYGDPGKALEMLRSGVVRPVSILAKSSVPNPAGELFLEARRTPSPAKIDAAVAAYLDRYRRDPTTIDVTSLVMLGKVDLAYELLDEPAVFKTMASATGVFFRINMRDFRNDARFLPLAARFGLVQYWVKTGKWPDFCQEANVPYDCKAEAKKLLR